MIKDPMSSQSALQSFDVASGYKRLNEAELIVIIFSWGTHPHLGTHPQKPIFFNMGELDYRIKLLYYL